MVRIEELNAEVVRQYRHEIADFYFETAQTCRCLEHYTLEQAYEKIGDLIDHLKTSTCVSYGAFEDNEIIGYIWAYPHTFREQRRMYINEICVKNGYRNRGIGGRMIRLIEGRAKELEIPALYLHAEAGNPDAIRLYESIGYTIERIQLSKPII